ncbi:DEAD/DEAH box helicase [Aphelenchoides fujianensis]|nr:DEAD/DEAH box helicase [Aphelenchoides fujianensis]
MLSFLQEDKQCHMFSATWPKEVRSLAADFQKDPVFLNVGSMELSANHNIEQIVEVMEEHRKQSRLFQILEACLNDRPSGPGGSGGGPKRGRFDGGYGSGANAVGGFGGGGGRW